MSEAKKTEVLPSISGFKDKLDWATQDDTITSRELRELRAKYEEEKGEIKNETQKKIEAFFKRMVDTMLKGGGFPITDPKKDFEFLKEHFGYSDDRIRQMQEYYDKKGALIVHQYDDGKVKFASGRSLGKGFFTQIGDVSYNKDNMKALRTTIDSEEKEKKEIIDKLLKALPPTPEFPLITDKNFTGPATIVFPAYNTIQQGDFSNGKLNGPGIMAWSNGDKFEGNYKDDRKEGKGIYVWSNGNKFEGNYKDDNFFTGTKTDKDGKILETWKDGVKVEPAVVSETETPSVAAAASATDVQPAIEPVKGTSGLGKKEKEKEGKKGTTESKEKPTETPEQKSVRDAIVYNKKYFKDFPEGGIKKIQNIVGAKEDGRIGKETIKKIQEFQKKNGLVPDGKIGPKTAAILSPILAGGVVKQDSGKSQSVPEVKKSTNNKSAEVKTEKTTSSPVVSTLSQENQEKLKAGKAIEVGKYTVTQMKADWRDWYSDDSGMEKKKGVPTETYDNTFELYLKDGQYILEMNGTGVFKDTTEPMGKDIPSPQALQKKMEEMMATMQKNGRETFAITHPELYTVAFNLTK